MDFEVYIKRIYEEYYDPIKFDDSIDEDNTGRVFATYYIITNIWFFIYNAFLLSFNIRLPWALFLNGKTITDIDLNTY